MSRLCDLSIAQASEKLQKKEISALDLSRDCLAQIEARNQELNAYLEVFDDIEAQAQDADARRGKGESHPLLGIPLAVKDNILIAGKHASAASKMLEPYHATYDATAIRKLKEAGALFLGRTNMDEFALGGSTEHSAFGVTRNPTDPSRVAGGTSGGSAAAVAAGMVTAALGSDTGGSVRNPASFCGVVGLKPTYGAVSRSGLIAGVSSFDQIGPLTKTVADARLLLDAICGKDPLDSTSVSVDAEAPRKKVIGLLDDSFMQGVDKDVLARFMEVRKGLESLGYSFTTIDLPSLSSALAAYYIINFAEVSTNLARFDGVRYGLSRQGEDLLGDYVRSRSEGFGPETRRRIILGTYVLSAGYYDAYYGKAIALREKLRQEYLQAFQSVDAIMTPTMPTPAFVVGAKADPLSLYLEDIFTVPANLTGTPALSLPMGSVAREGKELPVGVQISATHGGEGVLLDIGTEIEQLR